MVRILLQLIIISSFSIFPLIFADNAQATTYFVSTTGSDSNSGLSIATPLKTFAQAKSKLQPGDELKIMEGIYSERLVLDTSGTNTAWINVSSHAGRPIIDLNFTDEKAIDITGDYIEVSGLEVRGAKEQSGNDGRCINVDTTSEHVVLKNLKVHECKGHGIQLEGKNIIVDENEVYNTNLYYQNTNVKSSWGSAIKVRVGGENIIIKNNHVHQNFGEGVAVTRGKNVRVENNKVWDNYSVNLYVDNSPDTVVANNLSYCTNDSTYFKDGKKNRGIELAEEYYNGWGAQLNRIDVYNNIVSGCYYGITFFDGGQAGTAIRNIRIINNTIWNIEQTGISIDRLPLQGTNEITNNIVHSLRGVDIWTDLTSGINFHHNLWVSGVPIVSLARGIGDLNGVQPDFLTAPVLDDANTFKLSGTSLAINKGSAGVQLAVKLSEADLVYPKVASDYFGIARDANPDIGAHEFGFDSLSASPTPSSLPSTCQTADINLDGTVNLLDYTILVANFFSSNPNPTRADINMDGNVNLIDFTILSGQFLKICSN